MRVRRPLYFVAALPPPVHGQALVNELILSRAVKYGVEVQLLDVSPGTSKKKTTKYHARRLIRVISACWAIASGQVGVLYTVFESGFGFLYNILVLLVARLRGNDIVIHHHTSRHCKQRSLAFKLVNMLAGSSATHVALCDQMAIELRDNYRVRHAIVCQNYCLFSTDHAQKNKMRSVNGPLRLGYLANLSTEKGVLAAFEVFSNLAASGVSVTLEMAGPIFDASIEKSMEQWRDVVGFTYWGPIVGNRKQEFFESFDIFLFPTLYRYEAQPLVIIEAQQAEKLVYATNMGYIGHMMPAECVFSPHDYVDRVCAALKTLNEESISAGGASSRQLFERQLHDSKQEVVNLLHLFK